MIDEPLHLRHGLMVVAFLRPVLLADNNELVVFVDILRPLQPQTLLNIIRQPVSMTNVETQLNLGVDFVDILAAWPTRSRVMHLNEGLRNEDLEWRTCAHQSHSAIVED